MDEILAATEPPRMPERVRAMLDEKPGTESPQELAPPEQLLRLLIVEDDDERIRTVTSALRRSGFSPACKAVASGDAFRRQLAVKSWDVVIANYALRAFNAAEALSLLREFALDIPFIVISEDIGEEAAVRVIKSGAHDCLPLRNLAGLGESVRQALQEARHRRRALEELNQFKTTLDQTLDCVFMFRPDRLRFHYVNQGVVDLFGYSREELLEMTLMDLDPELDEASVRSILKPLILGETPSITLETVHRRKDRSLVPVELFLQYISPPGEPDRCVAIVRDITERKRLESQFRQAQKMEAIGSLAGGIAHDFNNILSAIIGYNELAILKLGEAQPVRGYLDEVARAAERARNLVSQILTFSRGVEHTHAPLEIRPIVREALNLLRATLPSTIEFRQNLQPDCGVIFGDPTQIHQVIMNLCTNAFQAMADRSGVLAVQLDVTNIDKQLAAAEPDLAPGRYVRLTVTDTGHGIPPEHLDKIFDPFFTTKPVGEGSGLGLATVHGIVKNHGGAIKVYSEVGAGTTMHVYFPRVESEAAMDAATTGPVPQGRGERILLVDDETPLVAMNCELLQKWGYRVTGRTESPAALEAFLADPGGFDLIMTDLTMPGMTGLELARRVMAIRPDLPIVLMTGFSEASTLEKARLMGIREFILKPAGSRELAKCIRRVLSRERED